MAFSNITNTLPEAHKLLQQAENLQWQRFWAVSIFGVALASKGNSLCNILISLPKRHNFEKNMGPTKQWVYILGPLFGGPTAIQITTVNIKRVQHILYDYCNRF